MGDMSLEQVTENYYDVLKEIGNIGAGNAMTALSQMLQCKVDMKVPQVRLLEFHEVGDMMGGEEQIMVVYPDESENFPHAAGSDGGYGGSYSECSCDPVRYIR